MKTETILNRVRQAMHLCDRAGAEPTTVTVSRREISIHGLTDGQARDAMRMGCIPDIAIERTEWETGHCLEACGVAFIIRDDALAATS